MTTSASGKNGLQISPCAASSSAMPEESARAVPAARQNELKTHQFILMCSGTRVNRRHQHTHGTGSSSRRSKSASASGNAAISSRETCLFFKYSHPHGATSLNSAWPCKAQMRPPCNFRSPAFSSGSWLPASRTGCTPASRHIRRKRDRFPILPPGRGFHGFH